MSVIPMTVEELKARISRIPEKYGEDWERTHIEFDELMLEFINDDWVRKEYVDLCPWVA